MSLQFLTRPPFTDISKLKDEARRAAKANASQHSTELDAVAAKIASCPWALLLREHSACLEDEAFVFTVDEVPVRLVSAFPDDNDKPIAVGDQVGISVELEVRTVREKNSKIYPLPGLLVTYSPNTQGSPFVLDIAHPTERNGAPLSPEDYGAADIPLRLRAGPVIEAVRAWMVSYHRAGFTNPLALPEAEIEVLVDAEARLAEIDEESEFLEDFAAAAEGWASPRQKYHLGLWIAQRRPFHEAAYLLMGDDTTQASSHRAFLKHLATRVSKRVVDERGPYPPEDVDWWGDGQARLYMMSARKIADDCIAEGNTEGAILILSDLLALNPNDNQGNRYPFLAQLLERALPGDRAAAQAILRKYDAAHDAILAYGGALLAFQERGDTAQARKLRQVAAQLNTHAPSLIVQPESLQAPWSYSAGSETEAIYCAHLFQGAYRATEGAVAWMSEEV